MPKRAAQHGTTSMYVYAKTSEAMDYLPIIRRDPCVYCGKPSKAVDHIVPVLHGGTGDWNNLAPVCTACNSQKHTKSLLVHLLTRCGHLSRA